MGQIDDLLHPLYTDKTAFLIKRLLPLRYPESKYSLMRVQIIPEV